MEGRRTMKITKLTLIICGVFVVSMRVASPVAASITCNPWVARMVSVQGNVEVNRAGQTQWQRATLNDTYCAGDRVQVGERSRADIALVNRPVIRLEQNTTITLAGVRAETRSVIQLLRGALYFFSRLSGNLEVSTAFVNAGVEGTEGLVKVESDSTLITIFEGKVIASNPAGSVTLTSGQSAIARQGSAPLITTVVRPRDAVQWALYYPPVLDFRPETFQNPNWQAAAAKSITAYKQGDIAAAFESIKGVPDSIADPSFFTYRAGLLLAVGRSDEARRDIERALSLHPADSAALALQAIIAVAQNDKEMALESGQKAVTGNPKSSSALIALSYAQQANFNLEGARASLKQAVESNPNDALAWARLAELHLSFADLGDALEAAQKATAIEPNLSRTQTVLGFAYLTQVKTTESKKAFERAIELDQGDPLPRLGLGLAKIREGDLAQGREELDIAVSLDPDSSLLRSYLGKAYFEEKLDKQSADQYEMAKTLDPQDPTPYFYDAIRKQTTNRPVEALQDLQKAIELNDNRAVYRSRLQLDSDLAARSASLGRIYSDLGFQQLALVEGWKSVNTDPTNFSAHRFLADSYAILPRHEIARVSELLQSQLLQPLNMTPIQPRLAEGNLFLIGAGGPAALSFNEFNPLFNRNGLAFQASGIAGENKTYSGEGVLAGIYNKVAFSLGGFHFQTNGWRPNASQKDFVGNGFLQWEVSPQTSLQAEVRRRETARGDIQQRFFFNDFSPDSLDLINSYSVRLSGRHSITPTSTILSSVIFNDRTDILTTTSRIFKIELPQKAIGGELQYLFRSQYLNFTGGAGYVDVHSDLRDPFLIAPVDQDSKHFNVYGYLNLTPVKNLTLTAGVSYDALRGADAAIPNGRLAQVNPKIGLTWNPIADTLIRASITRSLKRNLVAEQTLEPTQVAGFNQFFDDFDATRAWRYGLGIDQKISDKIFVGAEFSRRDLRIPLIDITVDPATNQAFGGKEYLGRSYLFWTPEKWLALRAEYLFEGFRNDADLGEVFRLNSHRIPVGFQVFLPSGFSAMATATYHRQHGELVANLPMESNFWTADVSVSYRLPNRYGSVSVGATNLFDKRFKYFDVDRNNVRIQPDRVAFFRLTLALP